MIISVTDLKNQINCGNATDDQIIIRLEAIEAVIRKYTNNNFQQRGIRFSGKSTDMRIYGEPQYFNIGDTVQISDSLVNDGLYVICIIFPQFKHISAGVNLFFFNRNILPLQKSGLFFS